MAGHGVVQIDMVLEKELRTVYRDPNSVRNELWTFLKTQILFLQANKLFAAISSLTNISVISSWNSHVSYLLSIAVFFSLLY